MIIIQNIMFPSNDFNPVLRACVRTKGVTNRAPDITELVMQNGSVAEFNTYFNGFSIAKWRKYTSLGDVALHLDLEGSYTVIMYNEYREGAKNVRKEINRREFSSVQGTNATGTTCSAPCNGPYSASGTDTDTDTGTDTDTDTGTGTDTCTRGGAKGLDIPVPSGISRGMISFALQCHADGSVLKGGYYYTPEEDTCPDARFAVDICTYNREKFVARNVELLRTKVFAEGSPLRDAVEVFISDNGQTLEEGDFCGGRIHVFHNKNTGGSGGFARGMIEILKSPHYDSFTHIIMMDDDVVFSYETLYRTFTLVRLLRPEYKDAFIGGAMLNLNRPHIQSESADIWETTKHRPIRHNLNIIELDSVLENEIEEKVNCFCWWYCVMPIGVVKPNNLPLPLFVKRDDIEYSLRNGRTFVTLNGICVLHEDFGAKRRGFLEYYYWRNICIINAMHCRYGKQTLKDQLKGIMADCLLRYRYEDANLAFRGVEDFLRGVDWLESTDAEALHAYITDYTYKGVPVDEISPAFSYDAYEKAVKREPGLTKKLAGKDKKVSKKTILKGWLKKKPAKLRYVRMNGGAISSFYAVRKVIYYDENTGTAFATHRSWHEALNLLRNYKRICKQIDARYDAVRKEYSLRAEELTSLSFWEKYLDLDGAGSSNAKPQDFGADTIIKSSAGITEARQAKAKRREDAKHLRRVRGIRFLQRLASLFLPLKRNRVCIYVHERKGYTCNPKYIAEELLKRYGKDVEIIWVTKYPEKCRELKGKGIKVVALNSSRHRRLQLTSKVVIVNDAFPEAVIIRPGQYTVNTWHACMNYKRIGYGSFPFRNDKAEKVFRMRNRQPKMYVSGSEYFTADTSASFGFSEKVFVPFGMPRNDIFFRDNAALAAGIRERYGLAADCRLVLYAPTFREGFKEDIHGIDFARVTKALHERFGGTWKVLYRKHYFVNARDVILDRCAIDVSGYEDMNELLASADVLISDYSSSLWDFSITKRPSFVYAPDLAEYHLHERDFSYPVDKWPYSISCDNDELERNILTFDEISYREKVDRHHEDAGIYDDGHASERVVDALAKVMKLKPRKE